MTPDPGLDIERVRDEGWRSSRRNAGSSNVLFDFRPKVHPQLMDNYYTPGAKLEGRCLYPFLHARVSFSGKVYFCPFIRVEVGDLTHSSLEEIWNGERYVDDAQAAGRATASFRSAAAAARWSCRPSRSPSRVGAGVARPAAAPSR